ncbi:hypothetical protein J5N97_014363 [Dioscorea zingiberensis]|uniref:Uncharacterized protein n=1 Tax=Dioscorea zingiberensis TaxID=325984 RepID=A0A9D5HJK2_9LILI|nr:hypothetical protein J5N97_014363 [Dioscorea zingiberensis]
MAGKKGSSTSSSSLISFCEQWHCLVEIEGKNFVCEPNEKQLTISVAAKAKINISVDDSMDSHGNLSTDLKSQDAGNGCFLLKDCSFLLVNPKNADDQSKCSASGGTEDLPERTSNNELCGKYWKGTSIP